MFIKTLSPEGQTPVGGVAAGVSAATRVTPKSFFLTQRDTESSVFCAGSIETQILSLEQHKEVGKDEAIKSKHFIRSTVLIGRLLCGSSGRQGTMSRFCTAEL